MYHDYQDRGAQGSGVAVCHGCGHAPCVGESVTIDGETTLAEIRAAAYGHTSGPGFIAHDRSVRSIQQSMRAEGCQVTTEQVRAAAMRVLATAETEDLQIGSFPEDEAPTVRDVVTTEELRLGWEAHLRAQERSLWGALTS
jgi:hypothetical protein